MIDVRIKAVMEMAAILEGPEKVVTLSAGSLIQDLLDELEMRYGEPVTHLLYETKRDLLQILTVNGRSIYFLDGLDTELKDGDQVFLMPLVAGG